MVIAGFDQAVKCIGFAHGEPGAIPVRGVHRLPEYGENTARLGKHVREWAMTFLRSIGAERVYFEQVLVRAHGLHMPTLMKQMKVLCAIETAAEMLGLEDDTYEVDIADWRREFYLGARPTKTPNSEAQTWKDMALTECLRRNWLVDDHNAGEACGIWFFGCLHTDPNLKHEHKIEARRAQDRRDGERRDRRAA